MNEEIPIVTLADGRRVAYLEVGDPDGSPVISCHGGLSSRLDVQSAAAPAATLGVRVICPDRPGIGGSDAQPARTLKDWPAEVEQLADHLGLGSFAVMGWSAGGMYAQACAAQLPDRVSRLGLMASVIPREWPGMIEEINRMDRTLMRLSGHGAAMERLMFWTLRVSARISPTMVAKRSGAPETVAAGMGDAIAAAMVHTRWAVQEYQLLNAPWGFDPASITVPTTIWQGTADDLVPPSWAERLTAAIPGAELHLVEGANHFLWYDHWDQVLGALTGDPA